MEKEKKKWKYKDKNMNFINLYNTEDRKKIEEKKKLLNLFDESKKVELSKIFEVGLTVKYDKYKKFLYESNLFLFGELQYNIKESVNCLIIGAYIASITNTNLILERGIKLALIQYEVGELSNSDSEEILDKYIKADKQYSGKSMEKNIQRCIKYKIFNEEEAKELTQYKLKFRDGFSHFTPKNILNGEERLAHIECLDGSAETEKSLKMPSFQSVEVIQFALNNAEPHLEYVLGIINHLQYKVLERFRKKSKGNK